MIAHGEIESGIIDEGLGGRRHKGIDFGIAAGKATLIAERDDTISQTTEPGQAGECIL